MVAFMLILLGISLLYSSLFGKNSKKGNEYKVLLLIIAVVFLTYGGYIMYLYSGGSLGRELLVGSRQKTAYTLVDTIGIGLFILTAIAGRLFYKTKKD